MKQITQQLKSGKMEILEVPFPVLGKGQVLVRNYYSVISPGTEGKTVTDARKGYVAKAVSRQKEVKQVINLIKDNGIKETYKMVINKLEAPSSLGYSCAGEIIAVADDVKKYRVGDLVACGGPTAVHADVITVPINLCAKIPQNVDLKEAAFTTLASIAIQGIRQASLQFGERCVVIGLGLIGQLTAMILDAAGIIPIGIDISKNKVELAKENGVKYSFYRNENGLQDLIMQLTNGAGADAIIITASTDSIDPVEFAGEIARKKAKIIIVGAVPTGFSRKNYFQKELELRMATSYGPGRYDANYEDKGRDYPIGYVRWTEQRNMDSFLQLLKDEKLNLSGIISHEYKLLDALDAYEMVLENDKSNLGLVIRYDFDESPKNIKISEVPVLQKPGIPNVGFIGGGSFAQNILLPNMKDKYQFRGIVTKRGNNSQYIAKKYGFQYTTDNSSDLFNDKEIDTVFIVTPHNLRSEYIIRGLQSMKNLFIEKPLAISDTELELIRGAYLKHSSQILMLGYNRRFSRAVKIIKNHLIPDQVKAINIRVNAGSLPPDHWVNDPEIGGGRIVGEMCHFIDLAMYLADSSIKSVSAASMKEEGGLYNTVSSNLEFSNGSMASIGYYSNGNNKIPKEFIEVFCGGTIYQIHDFKSLIIKGKKSRKYKFKNRDKGHREELVAFADSVKNGQASPIPFEEIYMSTLATFKVLESIQSKRIIQLGD